MASTNPPVPAVPSTVVSGSCCSGPTYAFLLLRLMLGFMLLASGVDKFKSPDSPIDFKWTYWHDQKNDAGQVVKYGKWQNVAKPVFEFGGFNNTAVYGEKGVNFISHIFKTYALVLPYAMLIVGFFILIGFLNRISILLGGGIWFSLAAGQLCLPDNPMAAMLLNYTLFYVIALALLRYNRFCVTRY